MHQCDELGSCTSQPGRITRLFLSDPMRAVHNRLTEWMQAVGVAARVDAAGNLIGRLRCASGNKVLLVGSHLDSVPGAGRYDGVLGTLLGVAVCEWLGDRKLPFHLDVLGFSEEEGVRYKRPYLGSAAVVGEFDPEWLRRVDSDGIAMSDAMRSFGLSPSDIASCKYRSDDVIGFIEPHLEQGPVLEQLGLPVGVVTGIVGQSRLRLGFRGQAGHVGTAPMLGRRDALVAAASFVSFVHSEALRVPGLKATVGSLQVYPNATNVIPGEVELSLDVRHLDNTTRSDAIATLMDAGERLASEANCHFSIIESHSQSSVTTDPKLRSLLSDTLTECGHEAVTLESGAGHDAAVLGQHFPMAMLFVRHPGGVSHHPDERVELEDVATSIEVLGQYVLKLADQFNHSDP